MNRVKKALCKICNLDGFAKMQNELLKVPTRERHSWVAIGIQKQQITPLTTLRWSWNHERAKSTLYIY